MSDPWVYQKKDLGPLASKAMQLPFHHNNIQQGRGSFPKESGEGEWIGQPIKTNVHKGTHILDWVAYQLKCRREIESKDNFTIYNGILLSHKRK